MTAVDQLFKKLKKSYEKIQANIDLYNLNVHKEKGLLDEIKLTPADKNHICNLVDIHEKIIKRAQSYELNRRTEKMKKFLSVKEKQEEIKKREIRDVFLPFQFEYCRIVKDGINTIQHEIEEGYDLNDISTIKYYVDKLETLKNFSSKTPIDLLDGFIRSRGLSAESYMDALRSWDETYVPTWHHAASPLKNESLNSENSATMSKDTYSSYSRN